MILNDDAEVHFRSSDRSKFFEATRIYKHGTPSGVQILQVQPTTEVINTRHVTAASRLKLKDHLYKTGGPSFLARVRTDH